MKRWVISILLIIAGCLSARAEIRAPDLDKQLDQFRAALIARAAGDGRQPIDIFREVRDAITAGRLDQAIADLEVLAGAHDGRGEGGFGTWLRLALTLQRRSDGPHGLARPEASFAAYGAYRLADSDEQRLQALLLLGDLLAQVSDDGGKGADSYGVDQATAHAIYAEIGALAETFGKDNPRQDRANGLAEAEFDLDRVIFPLPPGAVQSAAEGSPICVGSEYDDSDEDAVDISPDPDQTYRLRCSVTDRRNTCLVFNAAVATDPAAIGRSLTLRRYQTEDSSESELMPLDKLAMTIRDRSICFAGLPFGTHYEFDIAATLPSYAGGTIGKAMAINLLLPAEPPTLGFQRGAYVLPANGPQNIPIHAVNAPRARILIRRLGDLQIIREVVHRNLVGNFHAPDACTVLDDLGERIADVKIGLGDDRDNPTALPFGDLLRERAAWLATYGDASGASRTVTIRGATVTLEGDPAAAGSGAALGESRRGSGIYALFGRLTDIDVPPEEPPAPHGPVQAAAAAAAADGTVPESQDGTSGSGDAVASDQCDGQSYSTQWVVVTDIGLTMQRSHSDIYVVARALDTGAAISGARIEFVARSGAVLATATTDGHGVAGISARLGRGQGGNALVAVLAYSGNDFTFLDTTADSLTLADRGFEGRTPQEDYDAFVAPSRGVFRPGESVEALVLVRGPDGGALTAMPPVEVSLRNASGAIVGSADRFGGGPSAMGGAHLFTKTLPETLPEGLLTLEARVGSRVIGSAPIDVRFYQPDTISIGFEDDFKASLDNSGELDVSGTAKVAYLYGLTGNSGKSDAPAANVHALLDVSVEKADSPIAGCFAGYSFGTGGDDFTPRLFRGLAMSSDADGLLPVDLPRSAIDLAAVGVPLKAVVKLSVDDANGRARDQQTEVLVHRVGRYWVGLAAAHDPGRRFDQPIAIDAIVLDEDLKPVRTMPGQVQVYYRQNTLVWQSDGHSWQYVASAGSRQPIGQRLQVGLGLDAGEPETDVRGCPNPTRFSVPLGEAGTYEVELTLPGAGPGATALSSSTLEVRQGWTTAPDGRLEPDRLVVSARAAQFTATDAIAVDIDTPHEAGKVLGELVARGTLVGCFEADIRNRRAEASITPGQSTCPAQSTPVTAWPSGDLYVYATSFRAGGSDDSVQKGPGRAIGGVRVAIGEAPGAASVAISNVGLASNGFSFSHEFLKRGLTVEVDTKGMDTEGSGQTWVTLAAVSDGVLSLTNFVTPDPRAHYFGGTRLDFDVFDTYGRIVYRNFGGDTFALRPVRGTIYRSGDVVIWHGPIEKAADGKAIFVIPPDDGTPAGGPTFPDTFNGKVRLMAWAWNDRDAVATADQPQQPTEIQVRDPVLVRLEAPRFLAPGDRVRIPVTVANLADALTDRVSLEVTAAEPFALDPAADGAGVACGSGAALDHCMRYEVEAGFRTPERGVLVPVLAGEGADPTQPALSVSYQLMSKGSVAGPPITRDYGVHLRSPNPSVAYLSAGTEPIEPNATFTLDGSKARAIVSSLSLPDGLSFDPHGLVVTARLSRHGLDPAGSDLGGAVAALRQLDDLAHQAQLLLAEDGSAAGGQREETLTKLSDLVQQIVTLQNDDGGFPSDNQQIANQPDASLPVDKPSETGETAFALDVLSRARQAGVAIDDTVIDRLVGALLIQVEAAAGNEICGPPELYGLLMLARLGRINAPTLGTFDRICDRAISGDPVTRVLMAAANSAFGNRDRASQLMAALTPDDLRQATDDGDGAAVAQAVALYLEQDAGSGTDPVALMNAAGLVDQALPTDLGTESWLARANQAVLALLQRGGEAPLDPAAISCDPASAVAARFTDGIDLAGATAWDLERAPVSCINRSAGTLQATYAIEAKPTRIDAPYQNQMTARRWIAAGAVDDGQGVIQASQGTTIYFFVWMKPDGSQPAAFRPAAVQLLPAGFDVVDPRYQPAWEDKFGTSLADHGDVAPTRYSEVRDDRWISLPEIADQAAMEAGFQLGFSLNPTLQGTFVLPPLEVRDLNNPGRIAWTVPQTIIVGPPAAVPAQQ